MKFSTVLAFAGAAVAQSSFSNVTWTTEIVKSIVTYCPEPTVITHGSKTYTVTSATTLTITDCPCTVTKPVTKTPEAVCKTCNVTLPTTGKPAPPPATVIPTGGLPPKPSNPVQAGAAKLSGAGLAVVLGAAILL